MGCILLAVIAHALLILILHAGFVSERGFKRLHGKTYLPTFAKVLIWNTKWLILEQVIEMADDSN